MKEWGDPSHDFAGETAKRPNIGVALVAKPQAHFVFYDHGDELGLVAQGGGYIIDSNNVELLKNRIVYTLACLYGKDGGWKAHRIGARAVHCYVEVVGFMTGALKEFQESFNYGFKLLHGIGPKFSEISEKEKEKMTELLDELMEKGDFLGAMWMGRNRDSLRWYNGGGAPPESTCFFRRLAVRIFGPKTGWNLRKSFFS